MYKYQNNNTRYGGNYGGNRNNNGKTMDQDFYNPYSFVPLNDKLCLLGADEEEELSQVQDVPFENGYSGKIVVDFKAMSPFCVRSADNNNVHIGERYFVPGTTVKGMVRAVFEIVTMSNIRNGISDSRYSMRDLNSRDYEIKGNDQVQSGFLIQIKGQYYIHPCTNRKMTYPEIEKMSGVSQLKNCRSVEDKYRKLQSHIVVRKDGGFSMWFFSGFMFNKKNEYIFDIPALKESKCIPLEEAEYDDFIFIHEKENENASWKFWKKKLKNYESVESIKPDGYKGIVPCFFRTKEKKDSEGNRYYCVKDLGFASLYRQPYDHTIHDFLPEAYRKEGLDMSQSVFGFVRGNDALRGRVQFGNAFIDNPKTESSQCFILGSPKPTYYPFYIEQNHAGKLLTYFSPNARLAGYKRYLIQKNAQTGQSQRDRVSTTFVPMSSGTTFSTSIYFHNLRGYELGALLAAISFCKHGDCFHTLGYAKPFGYGKIKVTGISLYSDTGNIIEQDCLYDDFYNYTCRKCCFNSTAEYLKSLNKLFLIASGRYNPEKEIRYPNMQDKEFKSIKNSKFSLTNFTPKN